MRTINSFIKNGKKLVKLSIDIHFKKNSIDICKDQTWVAAQKFMDCSLESPNNKFIENELEKLGRNESNHKHNRLNSQRQRQRIEIL